MKHSNLVYVVPFYLFLFHKDSFAIKSLQFFDDRSMIVLFTSVWCFASSQMRLQGKSTASPFRSAVALFSIPSISLLSLFLKRILPMMYFFLYKDELVQFSSDLRLCSWIRLQYKMLTVCFTIQALNFFFKFLSIKKYLS